MSMSSAPARYASAWPSPEYSHEFEVTAYARPTPPVASTVAFAGKTHRLAGLRASSRTAPRTLSRPLIRWVIVHSM